MSYALTLRQPWASLVIHGTKDVENRSWAVPTTVRCNECQHTAAKYEARDASCPRCPFPFRLWIHAGKQYDERGWRVAVRLGVYDDAHCHKCSGEAWPRGVLLGSVLVTGCHRETSNWRCSPWAEPHAYHWRLVGPQPLPEPIPMRGRQRLWCVPEESA